MISYLYFFNDNYVERYNKDSVIESELWNNDYYSSVGDTIFLDNNFFINLIMLTHPCHVL